MKNLVLGQLKHYKKINMEATFKAMSKEEKKDFLCKLRKYDINLEMECGDGNTKEDEEEEGAVKQFHSYMHTHSRSNPCFGQLK